MYRNRYKFLLTGGLSSTQSGGGGGSFNLSIQEEGSTVQSNVDTINFVGTDVSAFAGGTGVAIIYIPPPAFSSHFNSNDGANGNQAVTENISRSNARISTPTSEGNPFSTNTWAGTNQSSTRTTTTIFQTPSYCTGFTPTTGGDAQFSIIMYDADGTTTLDSFTTNTATQPLDQDITYTNASGNISLQLTLYGADAGGRFRAKPTITVNADSILTANSREGGRFSVRISMTTDTATDGSGPYVFDMSIPATNGNGAVFLDTGSTPPSISGGVTIAETGGSVLTKHISGIEYYTLNSSFTIGVTGIDQLNRNTSRINSNLQVEATNYGITLLSQSPFGSGSARFSGWTNDYNVNGVSYSNIAFNINNSNFRYAGTSAIGRSRVRDTWGNSSYTNTSSSSILVDTVSTPAPSDTSEDFIEESYRTTSGYVASSWNSTTALSSGDALVYFGQLMSPSASTLSSGGTNTNWTTFSPNSGSQPNYSALGVPCSYYRRVPADSTSRASFTLVFDGTSTFVGGNALTDLINSNLEIFIRRIGSSNVGANTGAAAPPLRLHTSNQYNFATFDDGNTVAGSYIRLASSSGNTIEGTFGSFDCQDGLLIEIRLTNATIKLSGFDVTFN
jgi:hypothetical protein